MCGSGDVVGGLELDAYLVPGGVLRRVAAFLEHRAAHPDPPIRIAQPLRDRGNLRLSGVPEWCAAWVEGAGDWPAVFALLEGADFLQASEAVDVCAAQIAGRVCAWTKWERDAVFALPDGAELTEEEEAALREANPWVRARPARRRRRRSPARWWRPVRWRRGLHGALHLSCVPARVAPRPACRAPLRPQASEEPDTEQLLADTLSQ